jgi:lipopolysaccharide/colanic/teichoic acid biosynthesis glycosyltransferase
MLTTASAEIRQGSHGLYTRVGKRLLDVTLAASGLVVCFPLFVLCSVAIPLLSWGPVFFRQARVGQFGDPFWIFKFRTMVPHYEGPLVTAGGDPRITPLGKWLRKTKLDEVPQLLNILRGEMSIVGPRPEVPEYVADYTELQRKVLKVKPGLTGPASLQFVNEEEILARSPNSLEYYRTELLPRKLQLDLRYCEDISFWTDLHFIWLTGVRILAQRSDLESRNGNRQ